jgi:hypothetical protein
MAINDEQRTKTTETGNDVFGDPIAKVPETGVTAEIAEGQHRDRRSIGRLFGLRRT